MKDHLRLTKVEKKHWGNQGFMKPVVFDAEAVESRFSKSTKKILNGERTYSKTYHEGANDERTAILAKVRRTVKQCKGCESIEKWLLQRNERYRKNLGGL